VRDEESGNNRGIKKMRIMLNKNFAKELLQNVFVALSVSFIAISLGAALGVLSERGAFIGMLSAAVTVIITSAIGGRRVTCSGPTAPLTVVLAIIIAFSHDQLLQEIPTANPDHFVNIVLLLSAVFLLFMAVFRLGRFIQYIPNVVISGFMNGIAVLIWIDQIKKLFGIGKPAFAGDMTQNIIIVGITFVLAFVIPFCIGKYLSRIKSFLSGTLLTIFIMTTLVYLLDWSIETVKMGEKISSFSDFSALITSQIPTNFSLQILLLALPFAFQLAVLIYLDTLLTGLILHKMTGEETLSSKELAAQGVSAAAISTFGGLPGAQTTVQAVIMVKEKATMRIAGVMVGIFVLIEMFLFQDVITLIPQAVFSGILLKVGFDVLDTLPFKIYIHEFFVPKYHMLTSFFDSHREEKIFVEHREIFIILFTVALTVFFNLITAVGVATAFFYLSNHFLWKDNKVRDLKSNIETKPLEHEG
jgi:SulP family sulfate permease